LQAVSRNQRLSFLGIAAAIAVVAIVIFVVSGSGPEDTSEQAARTPTPTASGTSTPSATRTPRPPLLKSGSVKKLEYKEDEIVTFRVVHDTAEEVHVHGYDIKKELQPNTPATVSFKATITGIFEIEFENAGEQIAELRVDPK
jgi:hypothetical protein